MTRSVVVGLGGTEQAKAAAAQWATEEALLRGTDVHLVHAQEPVPKAALRRSWRGSPRIRGPGR
ncbi:hypothetical protein EES46_19255 [Streptomyces sp. ADI98-10]|nr:hypothetical protein EES46_19255 [Streptomyces sp. ADI98-10]